MSTVIKGGVATVEGSEKVRENRLRAAAQRQGLRLSRSRRRDPRALDYGQYWLTNADQQVVCAEQGLTLDEVEDFLLH